MESYYVIEILARERQKEIQKQTLGCGRYKQGFSPKISQVLTCIKSDDPGSTVDRLGRGIARLPCGVGMY
jgi:hypothetical protein